MLASFNHVLYGSDVDLWEFSPSHRYHCQYGPNDNASHIPLVTSDMVKRNENWMLRANSFQVERGTPVLGHPRGCEAQGSAGDANVDLSSSGCT